MYLCTRCHKLLGAPGYKSHTGKGKNRSNVGTFYLSDPYKDTWQEFRVICIREGTTASKKIVEFMVQYVMEHKKGNPQLLLEKFSGKAKQKCYRCDKAYPVLRKVEFVSGLKAELCAECLEHEYAKGAFCLITRELK